MRYSHEILFIIICCLFSQLTVAQNFQKVNSLELLLEFADNSKNKIEILLNISNELKYNDTEKALIHSQKAYDLSEEINYDEGILNSMTLMAEIHCNMTEYKAAMDFATKSKKLAEKLGMVKELTLALHIIGRIHIDLGDYDKSSKCFFECLKLSEQINNKEGI